MWSGNNAIEKCFDSEDICCWGSAVARVIDEIAPHGDLCSVWILLLRSIVAADPAVCYVALLIVWNVLLLDGEYCFQSGDEATHLGTE